MKASFSCPQCGHTQAAPESYIGRRSKCPKCEAVGEIIAGRPPTSVAAAADVTSKSIRTDGTETQGSSLDAKQNDPYRKDPLAIDTSSPSRSAGASNTAGAFQPSIHSSNAGDPERYPNLTLYLKIAATVTKIVTILAAGVWSLIGLAACIQTLLDADASAILKLATCFVTLVILGFGLLLIYLYYVAFMAIIELIRVVMDIERNTRRN